MTNHEIVVTAESEIPTVEQLYRDSWTVIRLAKRTFEEKLANKSKKERLAEKYMERRALATGLFRAKADGFDVIYGGEHYDKLEALFRPEKGSVEGRGWLGHLWLLNHKVQRRFDFRDGRIEITNMLANGRWTDPRPLSPEHFGEFDDILKGVETQLAANKIGQLALVEAA